MARKRVTIERDFFGNVTRYEERTSGSLFDSIFDDDDDDDEIVVVARPVRGRRVRVENDEAAAAAAAGGIIGLGLGVLVGALVGSKKKKAK